VLHELGAQHLKWLIASETNLLVDIARKLDGSLPRMREPCQRTRKRTSLPETSICAPVDEMWVVAVPVPRTGEAVVVLKLVAMWISCQAN
jgi:hypothetical protein